MTFKTLCIVCFLSLLLPRCAPRLLLVPSVDPDSTADAQPNTERSQVSDEDSFTIPDSVTFRDGGVISDVIAEQQDVNVVVVTDAIVVVDSFIPDVAVANPTDTVLVEVVTPTVDVVDRDRPVVVIVDVPVVTVDVPRDIVDVTDSPSVPMGRCRVDSNCGSGRCCAFPLVGQLGICGCPLSGICAPPSGSFCRE